MLDIIYTIFSTIVHSITTLINIVLSIPTYISYIIGFFGLIPSFIAVPLTIVVLASVLISIKRLII